MILKVFKEKSNEKYLNKLLLQRKVNVIDTKIESLGIILNVDEVNDVESFIALADKMNIRSNKLKIIAYSASKKESLNDWDAYYNSKDLGWRGTIKHAELKSFLNTKFDALISYYTQDELELKLLTVISKAQFKIGVLQDDERLNDLIIKVNLKEFDVFKVELLKYLTILNKIKE